MASANEYGFGQSTGPPTYYPPGPSSQPPLSTRPPPTQFTSRNGSLHTSPTSPRSGGRQPPPPPPQQQQKQQRQATACPQDVLDCTYMYCTVHAGSAEVEAFSHLRSDPPLSAGSFQALIMVMPPRTSIISRLTSGWTYISLHPVRPLPLLRSFKRASLPRNG